MILHIVKKDARRLWPQIAISLALAAALAWQDGRRADAVPGSAEGWLNLLLPLAWACLLAMAVQQESPADDRQFWLTRPYRKSRLLAAKAVFALFFIHLPALLAAGAVLAARGFSPLASLGELIHQQLLLAAMLTIPVLAAAAVFANLLQFVFAAIAIPAAIVYATAAMRMPLRWGISSGYEGGLAVLVPPAVAIVALQYLKRRLALARGLGIAAVTVAILVSTLAPPRYAYALRSAMSPSTPKLAVRIDTGRRCCELYGYSSWATIAIPLALDGAPQGRRVGLQHLQLEITGANGTRVKSQATYRDQPLQVFTTAPQEAQRGLVVRVDRDTLRRLGTGPVRLRGILAATFYEKGPASSIPLGTSAAVSWAGRCESYFEEGLAARFLKVVCASPGSLPEYTWVRLVAGNEHWDHFLGDASTFYLGPRDAWLSPLDRRQTVFHMVELRRGTGSQWLVPQDLPKDARLEVTTERAAGLQLVEYDFRGVNLSDWMPSR